MQAKRKHFYSAEKKAFLQCRLKKESSIFTVQGPKIESIFTVQGPKKKSIFTVHAPKINIFYSAGFKRREHFC